MRIQNTNDLFEIQLQTLYSVEDQLVKAIPLLAESASDSKLKKALQQHLETTKTQRERLQEIGDEMDVTLTGVPDQALMYILKSGLTILQEISDPKLRDSAIMGGTAKVEHYEMAAYESAVTLAKQLQKDDIAQRLNETLDEEKKAAKMVEIMSQTGIAEGVKKGID